MKQVFPRFCNPVNPKEPASQELPQNDELERMILEFTLPEIPFIVTEAPEEEFTAAEFCNNKSSFFPSRHFMESDNPYTCNSSRIC